jgi:ectoine hydroxylase-related dioxygenase (phytanoyl-CoA dioxygenase family)
VDWHRDQSIAVAAHDAPPPGYARPTVKHGVPHLDAPATLLDRMLIARVHLDPADAANGALRVLPGSHRGADWSDATIAERVAAGAAQTVAAGVGDVLIMRPRLYHASGSSAPGDSRHRRVLHLVCAPADALPDSLRWACRLPAAD